MNYKLSMLGGALSALFLIGCAEKPVETPPLPNAGSHSIQVKNPIGAFVFLHSNSNFYQGDFDLVVEYDKLPFKAQFDNCGNEVESRCNSVVILREELGGDRIEASFDLTFVDGYDDQALPITSNYRIHSLPLSIDQKQPFPTLNQDGVSNHVGLYSKIVK